MRKKFLVVDFEFPFTNLEILKLVDLRYHPWLFSAQDMLVLRLAERYLTNPSGDWTGEKNVGS